jgi:hypothetical protein
MNLKKGDTLLAYEDGKFVNNCKVRKITYDDWDCVEDVEVTYNTYSATKKVMREETQHFSGDDVHFYLKRGQFKVYRDFRPIKEMTPYSFEVGL